MKSNIHPTNYQLVVFQDESAGFSFLTRAAVSTTETTKWEDGNTYPLVKIHISSASHPFYTGNEKVVDIEGRVNRFEALQKAAQARQEARSNKAIKAKKAAEKKAAAATKDDAKEADAK